MASAVNRKRNHNEMSSSYDYSFRSKCDTKDLVELIEDGKTELEKLKIGFKNPNKLKSVKSYFDKKKNDHSHLTLEIKTLEIQLIKKKEDKYHCVYKVHIKAIELPAYFYYVHTEQNLIVEGEVYILQNVN